MVILHYTSINVPILPPCHFVLERGSAMRAEAQTGATPALGDMDKPQYFCRLWSGAWSLGFGVWGLGLGFGAWGLGLGMR